MERTSLGSFLRTSQAWCQQISEKQTLDYGIAFYNGRFPSFPEANQFREVTWGRPETIPEAFEAVSRFFTNQGLTCLRWAPAIDMDPTSLESFLVQRGFVSRRYEVFRLERWRELVATPSIRVLPARAMRSALSETLLLGERQGEMELHQSRVACAIERLDDPQLDLFVALVDKCPAGRCGLYQVGDIARIVDLAVMPAYSGRGVERTLLGHVLALAKRLAMPLVLSSAGEGERTLRELFTEAGFVPDGRFIEFDAPTTASATPP